MYSDGEILEVIIKNAGYEVKKCLDRLGKPLLKGRQMTLDEILARHKEQTQFGSDILRRAMAENEKDLLDGMVCMAKDVMKIGEEAVQCAVGNLRAFRKAEREQANRVRDLDRVFAYFKATGNPFPLLSFNQSDYVHDRVFRQLNLNRKDYPPTHEIYRVPDDWTPPATPVPAA